MEQSTSNHGKKLTDLGMDSKAWPFIEAQNLLKRLQKVNFSKDHVVFETAYALACDVAAADGMLEEIEIRFLQEIRYELNIDRLHGAAIERGARARHLLDT